MKAIIKLTLQKHGERETNNGKMGTEWREKAIQENNMAAGFLNVGLNNISELTRWWAENNISKNTQTEQIFQVSAKSTH